MVMDILDRAGNSARASTIVILEQENHVEIQNGQSISLVDRLPSRDGVLWIEEHGSFTVAWENVFANQKHVDEHYLAEVAPMNGIHMDDDGRSGGTVFLFYLFKRIF